MSEAFRCASCGGERFTVLHRDLPDLHLADPGPYRAQLVRCETCRLVAQWPQPSDAELASFYPDEYTPFRVGRRAGSPLGAALRRRLVNGQTALVTRHRRSGRILDVGCSTGAFLDDMRALGGWECMGIELGHDAAQAARARGLTVFEMDLNRIEARPELGIFDVITMWDVLEHLRNPVDALRRLGTMLVDDGVVAIGVPNIGSWEASVFGRTWSGLEAPRHLHVFDPQTIAAVASAAGYEVLAVGNGTGLYSTFVNTLIFTLRARGVSYRAARGVGRLLRSIVLRRSCEPLLQIVCPRGRAAKMVAVVRKRRPAA